MEYCVFIQTNHKQYLGALVAEYSLKRNSKHADKFDVRIMELKNYPFFQAKEGQIYLRDNAHRKWLNDDLQSFTLTRMCSRWRMCGIFSLATWGGRRSWFAPVPKGRNVSGAWPLA